MDHILCLCLISHRKGGIVAYANVQLLLEYDEPFNVYYYGRDLEEAFLELHMVVVVEIEGEEIVCIKIF